MQETQVLSLGQGVPWRRKWRPTPVLLPGEFHGQRSLAGYSPWDRRVEPNYATNFFLRGAEPGHLVAVTRPPF